MVSLNIDLQTLIDVTNYSSVNTPVILMLSEAEVPIIFATVQVKVLPIMVVNG